MRRVSLAVECTEDDLSISRTADWTVLVGLSSLWVRCMVFLRKYKKEFKINSYTKFYYISECAI